MLSERITALFSLLQCNNTTIARFAGCSPGNISKLKTGNREPKSDSKTIAVFAEGVYRYADYENLLPALAELCHAGDTDRKALIPALIRWLYDTEEVTLPQRFLTPKSKKTKSRQLRRFGERLSRAMTLLELSNVQLATQLNVDVSLVSRYRSGIYSPHRNIRLSNELARALVDRAGKTGQTAEVAALCGTDPEHLDPEALASWLYDTSEDQDSGRMAESLLQYLEELSPDTGLPFASPEIPEVPVSSHYIGMEGLRSAVIRFLSDAAREGGTLLLYSDEPMEWMTGDRGYFALWASLMVRCVNNGVKIRIIHNVDWEGEEMTDAIKGWFPLYTSGMIEPYVFRKVQNNRFCHTVFLRTGAACIHGFFPSSSGGSRWYEYITDPERLEMLKREYTAMLSDASPFLKVYNEDSKESFHRFCRDKQGERTLLTEFPVFTMPEKLLSRILSRAGVEATRKEEILVLYRGLREQFMSSLRDTPTDMLFYPGENVPPQGHLIPFGMELMDLSIYYTREEYDEHLTAIQDLVQGEKNFHLTLLPDSPFRRINIVLLTDAVTVLSNQPPYGAFVFQNPALTRSVSDYLSQLTQMFVSDRRTTIEALQKMKDPSAL